MSFMLATINLSTATQPFQIPIPSNLQLNQIGWIEFLNESPYKVVFNCGGFNVPVTAWQDYPLQVSNKNVVTSSLSLPMTLTWTLLTNTTNVPTELDIVIYWRGETPAATSPVALTRQVASTVSNASSVTNTGFPAGTVFLFGIAVGDPQVTGSFSATNTGTLSLGDNTYTGQINLIDGTPHLNQITPNSMHMTGATGNENLLLSSGFTQLAGGTTGTATLWMMSQGNTKIADIYLNNMRTAGVDQFISFPTAFTGHVLVRTGSIGGSGTWTGFQLYNSGAAQTIAVITSLAVLGGAATGVTTMYAHSFGETQGPIDQIKFVASAGAGVTGHILLIGT